MADINEFLRKIKSDLPGEINGVKEYANLAKMAEDEDHDCWAAMMKDMAREERTHAKHIMHILDKNGVSYSELAPAFHEAEKMLQGLK
jgi:rubrerythrin